MGNLTLEPPTPAEYLAMNEEEREEQFNLSLARLRACVHRVIGGEGEDGE